MTQSIVGLSWFSCSAWWFSIKTKLLVNQHVQHGDFLIFHRKLLVSWRVSWNHDPPGATPRVSARPKRAGWCEETSVKGRCLGLGWASWRWRCASGTSNGTSATSLSLADGPEGQWPPIAFRLIVHGCASRCGTAPEGTSPRAQSRSLRHPPPETKPSCCVQLH